MKAPTFKGLVFIMVYSVLVLPFLGAMMVNVWQNVFICTSNLPYKPGCSFIAWYETTGRSKH